MPGTSGRQVADAVSTIRPDIRVRVMSGYTDDEQMRHSVREFTRPFLQKPFTPAAFSHKLREVMEASRYFIATPSSPA